ncbi:MAG: zinc metallopeptidase [Clostridia bacterium]|nr:zinc metallopeptidase [Clostridia bacterium]
MPFYFPYYMDVGLIFVLIAAIFAMIASASVNSTFQKYSKVASRAGLTGAESARRVLAANGVTGVTIERVSGNLTDHFDPKTNTIRLSESVYDANTVAAVGVAAHEAGHAVQYAVGYAPIKLRAAIIPITNIGSNLALPLVLIGLLLSAPTLAYIGIGAFSLSTIFQLITLPVEFNASSRAIETMENAGMGETEINGSKKVLRAAAMTYVAALAVSLANLLRLFLLVNRRNNRR